MNELDRAWLILGKAHLHGENLARLLQAHGSATAIVAARRNELPESLRDAILRPDENAINRDVEWLQAAGHHLVHPDSPDYPELMRQMPGAPTLLYVVGNCAALNLPSLAIVGSRNPTRGGMQNAYEFAKHLAGCGFCIVSGLAQGIDTAAHNGALASDAMTVAVLGHGIDRVYPAANRDLAHRIAASGALISEYSLGTAPKKEHFPQRNRLISGLSLGTLVVEAARQSGSLITARLSSDQGREVFAIPGSIHNPMSRGCHKLIREGAKLVESAEDIVNELGSLAGHLMQNTATTNVQTSAPTLDPEYKALLEVLAFDPATADQLAERSGLTIEQVSSMLLILELEGKVETQSGGRYSQLRNS
ncbi:MAG: DNA-processing protein DprA [Gammaproteobacteria bacterium]|nr:DNA-processing protein DprA [Gammaproteobacteria bacterium]MDH4315675.1 DNA-processing protein DprA [Gammaproteobacteria bacterium]MDH5214749.1 DNA-processing protein DprA [Gammaproteobacteria bacterium]MDH5499659.1 DNA-processing protein DprA [Gammaproteobacteria bacterium]